MSKIVRFHKTGGPEVLQIEELPDRPLRRGEVRLKVAAFMESNEQIGKIVVTVP